ncbi:alpha/beta fold hydrolase [Marivirga arenosa]|uniref:Alpha/beta hydrolase n=1 Tax=Marivirga arenosa TaxID=3059076 RepID=A0AA49J994_9BACT|nr:alpha/beta hydrolase [Marivirga sp. BKB1-2]WKK79935.1 alpha/beta hydrolase [Marivirga sp. BKB1-2]
MNNNYNILRLSDGRNLAFNEYGDLNGYPIIALHGLPGSRIWFKVEDEISKSLGIRLITIDRPGFGNSTPSADVSFMNFSKDIMELIHFYGYSKVSILGLSGGGVFALAVASMNSPLIQRCGIVSTVGKFKKGKPPKHMASENKMIFRLAKQFPWLLKKLLNAQKNVIDNHPDRYINSIISNTKHLCRADKLIIENKDNAELLLLHMREAFKNGVQAATTEAKLFTKSWDFCIKDIKTKIELWHGMEDTLSPIQPLAQLGNELQNCTKHFIKGKGHYLTEDPEIWRKILLSLK